jgi:hypothetical protein
MIRQWFAELEAGSPEGHDKLVKGGGGVLGIYSVKLHSKTELITLLDMSEII